MCVTSKSTDFIKMTLLDFFFFSMEIDILVSEIRGASPMPTFWLAGEPENTKADVENSIIILFQLSRAASTTYPDFGMYM